MHLPASTVRCVAMQRMGSVPPPPPPRPLLLVLLLLYRELGLPEIGAVRAFPHCACLFCFAFRVERVFIFGLFLRVLTYTSLDYFVFPLALFFSIARLV